MRLPMTVVLLGYTGLLPFLAGPLWLSLSPQTAPLWLDHGWLAYVAMIASFMAGSFWGFALPASEGPAGAAGLSLAALLAVLAWVAVSLPLDWALPALVLVFLLLLAADFWRERTLGSVAGYFALRSVLTAGACAALVWRMLL